MVEPPETEERPRGLAGEYLEDALEALHHTGDAASLFSLWAREERELEDFREGFAQIEARNRRRRFARSCVLFAALAAEAYVNEFLAEYLSGKDREAVDRMSPIDKYVVGTKVATGKQLFRRDAEPIQTLQVLFKHRDKLVHPKPGYGPPRSMVEAANDSEGMFTPDGAAEFILCVAATTSFLVRTASGASPDIPADLISTNAKIVADYAARASRTLPDRRAAPELPLLIQLMRSIGSNTTKQR